LRCYSNITINYNVHIYCQQFIYGLMLCNFNGKMFRTSLLYFSDFTFDLMSASAAFFYSAEKKFVINNIEKCRKLSPAEGFSSHCHLVILLLHVSICMYKYIYFYTFSVSDLFSVFLRRDERSSCHNGKD